MPVAQDQKRNQWTPVHAHSASRPHAHRPHRDRGASGRCARGCQCVLVYVYVPLLMCVCVCLLERVHVCSVVCASLCGGQGGRGSTEGTDREEGSAVPESEDGEGRPASPSALVKDGKLRNATKRNVVFDGAPLAGAEGDGEEVVGPSGSETPGYEAGMCSASVRECVGPSLCKKSVCSSWFTW